MPCVDTTQLLKGVLDLAVMAVLRHEDGYGYDVLRRLRAAGLADVGDASVYGTLRRLFHAGYLTSYVVPSDEGPHRKYYALNAASESASSELTLAGAPSGTRGGHGGEVEAYVAEVRAALADLPAQLREDLLEDLSAHLSEVAAEGEGSLRDRLGPPEQYAAELRTTVQVGPRVSNAAAIMAGLRAKARVADSRLGPLLGYAKASDFVSLLRPGWWLLRGYVAAMVLVDVLDLTDGSAGLLPRVGGNALVGLVLLAGFMVGSIWLGRRQYRLSRWPRRALYAGTAVLVLAAFIGFFDADDTLRGPAYYEVVNNDPIVFNGGIGCDTSIEPGNIYPRCPERAPFLVRK